MIRRLFTRLLWEYQDWRNRRFWRRECAKQGHGSCYERLD